MRFSSVWLIALCGLVVSTVILGRFDFSRRSIAAYAERANVQITDLVKRKGGGGGGKGGSGGGGKTGSSSSSSSGSSSSSARGGTSKGGSGAPKSSGGYYGGGASVPYTAGNRSPKGIAPLFLGAGALGFLGGAWIVGAYMYPYNNPYRFYNASSKLNETKNINCLCQQYQVCGCDDNDDQNHLKSIVGDGDPSKFNSSLIKVADYNGNSTIFLNGTLPNGTTADGPDSMAPALHVSPVMGALVVAIGVATAMLSM